MPRWLTSDRIVLRDRVIAGSLEIRDGKIARIIEGTNPPQGSRPVDARGFVVMPGLVDTHAHINEPGRTDWEGFETATRAAAAGGITTVIDMPLNSIPPTVSVAALGEKATSAEGQCSIDYGFWGGVIPGNQTEIAALAQSGVMGFKCFLIDSGVEEFPPVSLADLETAMPLVARTGLPLIVHAELESPVSPSPAGDPRQYRSFLESRPDRWECEAIALMCQLAEKHKCRVHIVHLSSAKALSIIRSARNRGVQITVETCPHYLLLNSESIGLGQTQFKCCPPIREESNRLELWKAVKSQEIDFVVSDHSPCPPAMKRLEQGDFNQAWGGISSLQFGLSLIWTELQMNGGTLTDLAGIMATRAAAFVGLEGTKGVVAEGADADFVVWNPEAEQEIGQIKPIFHRHQLTPYQGRKVKGVVETTILRGQIVYSKNSFNNKPRGQRLVPRSKPRSKS